MKPWLAAALAMTLAPTFASANDQIAGMFGDEAPWIEAFETLQTAVAADDAETVAGHRERADRLQER